MTAELFAKLMSLNVRLQVIDDKLDIQAPKGVLNNELLNEIKVHKEALIRLFNTYKDKRRLYRSIPKIGVQESYAISSSQRRLWVLSQFEEANMAYNMAGVFVFDGNLVLAGLSYSFDRLIERHEILRTVFREEDSGEIRQYIKTAEGFDLFYKDLRKESLSEKELEVLIQEEVGCPFDLSLGPLMRARVYQVEDNKYFFIYVMHHIISDGWSMGILIRELLDYYNGYISGSVHLLPALQIQYKDYAFWQQEQVSGDRLQEHKAYWKKQFEGELPVLELPGDRLRPAVKTYHGGCVRQVINSKLLKKLKRNAHEQGGTLFMFLLASVNTLLYRYTGQEDIIIGSPIAGREHADLEDQIGFYVNTLALRTRFNGSDSFREILDKVKHIMLGAYEHQVYPFDELVDELNLHRDLSRNPLFDVMLVLQNASGDDDKQRPGEIVVSSYKGENVISKFDLLFSFVESEDSLELTVEYNSDIYDRGTADRMASHLNQLLEAVSRDPSKAISDLSYLSKTETDELLVSFNDTERLYPSDKTVLHLFEEQVLRTPGNRAVVFDGVVLSYEALNKRCDQLAFYLQEKVMVKQGDYVGVLLDRSEWSVISMIAVMKAGCIYVPVDKSMPELRIRYMVEESSLKALIIDEMGEEFLSVLENRLHLVRLSSLVEGVDHPAMKLSVIGDDISYVVYTSGSTGTPKGVEQTHRTLYNLIQWCMHGAKLNTGNRFAGFSSFSFDVSLSDTFYVLATGGEIHIIPEALRRDLWQLKDYLVSEKISTLSMPYAALKAMFSILSPADFLGHSLEEIISAGEQLYVNGGLQQFLKNNPSIKLHNLYGPSETHVVTGSVYSYAEGSIPEKASIGRPVYNTTIYILDKQMMLVPIGIEGEVYIGGWNLAAGYSGSPELTAEKFIKDPFKPGETIYRSGDIAKWLPNGEIEYLRRMDNQLKINGYRVEPGEIESTLRSNHFIEEAVVMAWDMADGDKELAAYTVSKKTISPSELHSYLSDKLPAYMVPVHYIQLDNLPLTSNGKVDKRALPVPGTQGIKDRAVYVAPGSETEQKLALIWDEILGREGIGIKDNFFDLGGHSLKATRLTSQIKKQFVIDFSIKNIFKEPTVEGQAIIIDGILWIKDSDRRLDQHADREVISF